MPNFIVVEPGTVFGFLTVVGVVDTPKGVPKRLQVVCRCGKTFSAVKGAIMHGNTTSCGCKRKETLLAMLTTHGLCGRKNKHPLYGVWFDMLRRCYSENYKAYRDYGARGITVTERWHRFENFLSDMGERPFLGATVERKNVNGNYEPSNCVWASRLEQAVNKRKSLRYSYRGAEYTERELFAIAATFGVTSSAVHCRLNKGVAVEAAVESPLNTRNLRRADMVNGVRQGIVFLYKTAES